MSKEIILIQNFIMATRDSGYKNTASALAEIVDNSLEANATKIEITIHKKLDGEFFFSMTDNGNGMTASELNRAIQFGGSSKFNSRRSLGRYGMGLPNSSMSVTRRVEVFSWTTPDNIFWTYLDADEIASGKIKSLPNPQKKKIEDVQINTSSGTIIKWTKCDRVSNKNLNVLIRNINLELGRIFRYHLWAGKKIIINNLEVLPIDPMFLKGASLIGGEPYGEKLKFSVKIPDSEKTSEIQVSFVELPIAKWHNFTNEEKGKNLITKRAGASVLRSQREIDYGWFFMGGKRKENYDDWWRCEISFDPELDELFGVTHTKQEIHPGEVIKAILVPEIEATARILHNRVRNGYLEVKKNNISPSVKSEIEMVDKFIEPPKSSNEKNQAFLKNGIRIPESEVKSRNGVSYSIQFEKLETMSFFSTVYNQNKLSLLINTNHPFYNKVYRPVLLLRDGNKKDFLKKIEILIFAAARAESLLTFASEKKIAESYLINWSKILATFLS